MSAAPAGRGWSTAELFQCIKVLDVIDAASAAGKQEVLLEPTLYQHLKMAVEGYRWTFALRGIADFIKCVTEAKQVDPNEPIQPTDVAAAQT